MDNAKELWLTESELAAACETALALFQMKNTGLIEERDGTSGAYKIGFADGAKYICELLGEKRG